MACRRLGILLCAFLACQVAVAMVAEDGVSELQSEGETVQKEDDMPVKRDDLQPKEEDEAEAIPDVKSLKKFIFKKERQVQSKEMSKGDDDASEELAIGDTLRSLESKHAVEDELASEVQMDCEVSEWGKFGKCDKLCDGGHMKRERQVETQPRNGGKTCPELSNEIECNTESCASEAYQRRATRRKLTQAEKRKETIANAQKIRVAMNSDNTYDMMKRTREVMRKMVHTAVATVKLPGETGERSAEAQVRKSLKEAMARNAVTDAMKTYDATKVAQQAAPQSEADKKAFKEATRTPTGRRPGPDDTRKQMD